MQRKNALKTTTPVNPRRKQPRRQSRELEEAGEERVNSWAPEVQREVLARSHGVCEWSGCANRGREMHHRKLRRYGDHRAANALHLCKSHHDLIHAHPMESYEAGLLVRSTLDPALVTVDFAAFGLEA